MHASTYQAQFENVCFISLACVAHETSKPYRSAFVRAACLLSLKLPAQPKLQILTSTKNTYCAFTSPRQAPYALTRLLALTADVSNRQLQPPEFGVSGHLLKGWPMNMTLIKLLFTRAACANIVYGSLLDFVLEKSEQIPVQPNAEIVEDDATVQEKCPGWVSSPPAFPCA